MKIKNIMHHGVITAKPGNSLKELSKLMQKEDIGAIPILENNNLVGMVTDRDIVLRGLGNGKDVADLCARDVMSQPVIFCTDNEDVDDAVRLMEQNKIRRLPVVNAHHELVGMVSLGDIAAQTNPAICVETVRAVAAHHS